MNSRQHPTAEPGGRSAKGLRPVRRSTVPRAAWIGACVLPVPNGGRGNHQPADLSGQRWHWQKIFRDYRTAIERYFIPLFGSRHLERIDHRAVSEFEQWRNQQMGRAPAHSTLLTYAAAWQRIHQTALERGWITERQPWPRLGVQGRRAQARPGFTAEETEQLRAFLVS